MSKSKLQQAAVKLFTYKYPRLSPLVFFKISNKGLRNNGTGKRYKAEGLRDGVADMMLAIAARGYNGAFILFIFGNNKQTESQLNFEAEMKAQGYYYIVIDSLDKFEEFMEWYVYK